MSRFRKFAHSLVSGYVLLGSNILYTLASVPLALKYLSKPEFGLWGVTSLLAGYIGLIDMGMSGSVARILIDHKDERRSGGYGGLIKTGALVGAVQGILIFIVGGALAFVAGPLLNVPAALERDFIWLMIGQCALLGISFASRIFSHVLTAYQRYDITNYAQTILFAVSFGIMWVLLKRGLGVFSILWAQAIAMTICVGVNALACWRLSLFPGSGEWGRASWRQFKELFAFGRDIFLFALGSQLVTTSQALLLTRFLGLETAAVWNICTRAYTLLLQMIYRVFDYSSSALAEMMVRGEKDLVALRFQQIVVLSTSLSVVAATLFALCNNAFVQLWTSGRMHWQPFNDLLLALSLVISVSAHAHLGLVGQTKRFRFLRYVFFVEGMAFIGLTIMLQRLGGVTVMLLASLASALAFSFPYGLRRTREYFKLSWKELAEWHRAPFALTLLLVPLAAMAAWLTAPLTPFARLLTRGSLVGIPAAWMLLRYGLGKHLQAEVASRLPGWMRSLLARVCFFERAP